MKKYINRLIIAAASIVLGAGTVTAADVLTIEGSVANATVAVYKSATEPSAAPTGATVTTIAPGEWIILEVTPNTGYWTYGDILTIQGAGSIGGAETRTRSGLMVPLHPTAASSNEADGTGYYYMKIPAEWNNADGFTKVIIGGDAVQKIDLSVATIDPSTPSASEVSVSATTGGWTATFKLDKTKFTYNGSNQGPAIISSTVTLSDGNTTFTPAVGKCVSIDGQETIAGDYSATLSAVAGGCFVNSKSVGYSIKKVATEISVSESSLNLKVNEEVATGATLTPAEAGSLTYSSSNESVAQVVGGKIKASAEGTATITVSFPGNTNYAAATSKTITVNVGLNASSVSVGQSTVNLYVGGTHNIVATTTPTGLNVTYSADASGVVSVDDDGKITALKEGTGTITVKVGGDGVYAEKTTTVTVTVSKVPTEITVANDNVELKVNEEVATGATLSPAEAGSLTYSSNNEAVAKVVDGKIKAYSEGTATITVSFAGNDKYAAATSKTITVNVGLNVSSVSVDQSTVNLYVGGTHNIVATTTPDGLNVNYVQDDSGVYSVDGDGKITALKEGTGTITVKVGGDGVYAETTTTVTVTVTKATPTVTAPTAITDLTFTGSAQDLVIAGTTTGGTLQYALSAGGDYSASIPQGTKAGTYTIYYKVVGDDKYKDVAEAGPVTVTIGPKALVEGSDGTLNISLSPETSVFNNSDQKPVITVKDGDTPLTLGTDYTVTYKLGTDVVTETKNVNTYTVVIANKDGGNYAFTSDKTFTITKAAITSVTLDQTTLTFNGLAQTVNVISVKAGALDVPASAYTISGNTQTTVNDYTVRVTAKDDSNFSGYAETQFSIISEDANTFNVSGIDPSYEYTGADIKPTPVVKDGEKVLAENTDYTVSYSGNKNVGQATVTVTGIGNYTGTKVVNFDITAKPLTITANAKTITYGDTPANDGVTYSGFAGSETAANLNGDISYTYNSEADGTGTPYIAGSEAKAYYIIPAGQTSTNYAITFVAGVLTVNAKTVKDEPGVGESQITIELSPTEYAYDGNEKKPAVTVKDGETPISVNEYTVSYANNVKVGTATVTITDNAGGNYTVSGKKTFVIYRALDGLFANGNEWATFVAEEDLAVPVGLEAYVVSRVSGTTMNTEAAAYVAKGVGILLKRTDKTVNSYKGYAYVGEAAPPVSLLRGSATAATNIEAYEDYVLYNDQFELAGVSSVAKGHAYLPKAAISGNTGSRRLSISVGNGTDLDGIDAVFSDNEETEEKWYDLNGCRLSGKPTRKGLYIKDGRKVVIK